MGTTTEAYDRPWRRPQASSHLARRRTSERLSAGADVTGGGAGTLVHESFLESLLL